jgi:hypothetical protein
MKVKELVEAVKDHAEQHYDEGGWDVIVECYDDAEIAEVIKGVRTVKGALARFAPLVSVWDERQTDARISAGEELAPEPEPEPWRPCCAAYNTTCCGHEDYEDDGPRWPGVTILSPDYSNHHPAGWPLCAEPNCQRPECLNPPF